MSISNSYPTQRPTLNLDFANSGKLDSRISYSRSSTGTYLSNEKSLNSENLLLQSQDFDTSPWDNHNLATSGGLTGGQTAPDGTSTAWLMTGGVSSGSVSSPSVYMNLFGTAAGMVQPNSQNTYVMHVKAGTATHAWVTVRGDSANYVAAVLDFSNTSSLTTYQSGWTLDSSTVTALGNSWYRIALTFTSNSAVNFGQVYVGPTNSNTLTTYYPQWPFNGETMYAWGAQLSSTNSKVYDSPTTTQISREYAPLLKTAAANAPRFEYATDGQSEGLLIESQATNLIANSNDFSTGSIIDNLNIEAATGIAPNGTLSASLLRATGSTSHRIRKTVNVTSGKTYSASVYVKASGYNYLYLSSGNTSVWAARAYFDLSNGTVGTVGFGTASIEDVGNGYFRCSITGSVASSSSVYLQFNVADADGSTSFTSNDYGGLLAYGLQFEEGSAPSSLIQTNGSSVSRAADSCSVDLSQINYSGGDTSVIVDIPVGTGNGHLPYLFDLGGSNVEQMALYKASFTASASTNWSANAAGNGLSMSGSSASGTLGLRVSTDNFRADSSNSSAVTDSSITVSPWTSLHLGSTNAGNYRLNGHIKRVALYNVALSDTELQALTS